MYLQHIIISKHVSLAVITFVKTRFCNCYKNSCLIVVKQRDHLEKYLKINLCHKLDFKLVHYTMTIFGHCLHAVQRNNTSIIYQDLAMTKPSIQDTRHKGPSGTICPLNAHHVHLCVDVFVGGGSRISLNCLMC